VQIKQDLVARHDSRLVLVRKPWHIGEVAVVARRLVHPPQRAADEATSRSPFCSNVARHLESRARRSPTTRDVALVGRSLWRMDKAARDNGYLADVPRFLTEDEAGYVRATRSC